MGAIDTAVVLAAGEGSRLRPLTRYRPKPMLPVANRPVIEYVIDALLETTITDIVVVVGHRHTRIQDHLMGRYPDVEVRYEQQRNQLGSGDALAQVVDEVSGPFVVVNGDNVIDATMVRETVRRFEQSETAAAVAVASSETASEYGTVCTENERITAILERDKGAEQGRINVGVYAFDDRIFDALEDTSIRDGELSLTAAIPGLDGTVAPAVPDGVWYDPAYPWDLLAISEQLQTAHPELVSGPETRPAIADTARVHEDAVVEEYVLIGPGCQVSPGAVLRPGTCLHSDVRIGSNSVVNRSLVGADTTVGPNSVLRDTVVGEEVRLGGATTAPGGPADFVVQDRLHRNQQLGSLVSDRANVGANVSLAPGARIGPDARVPHGNTVSGSTSVSTGVVR